MKGNMIMRAAALLLCLVLVSTCMLSGMLAKYTAKGSWTNDARVAKFGTLVLEESTGREYSILPGAAIAKDPTVKLGATEVATRIYVTLTMGSDWRINQNKTGYEYVIDTGNGQTLAFLSFTLADGWIHDEGDTFYRDVPASSTDVTCHIIESDRIYVSPDIAYEQYYRINENGAPEIVSALNIDISARAVQID